MVRRGSKGHAEPRVPPGATSVAVFNGFAPNLPPGQQRQVTGGTVGSGFHIIQATVQTRTTGVTSRDRLRHLGCTLLVAGGAADVAQDARVVPEGGTIFVKLPLSATSSGINQISVVCTADGFEVADARIIVTNLP